jgi:hypothetical protein
MLQRSHVLMSCLALALMIASASQADPTPPASAPSEQKAAATPAAETKEEKGFAPGKEPTGFGKLAFGSSLDDAKKLYPKIEKEEQVKIAQTLQHPYIERFSIGPQKVEGLEKPCVVELRFWKKRFWLAVISFGENTNEAAESFLVANFGPPTGRTDRYLTWRGKKAASTADLKQRWYDVHDETISNEVREAWVSGSLRQTSGQTPTTPAPGTPVPAAATPAK